MTDKTYMKPLWNGPRPEVFYFKNYDSQSHLSAQSYLKKFILFLKMRKIPLPIKFSYVDEEGPLIPALSLRENIILNSVPSFLSSNKSFCIQEYILKQDNQALIQLFSKIDLLDDLPYQVDSRTRKITALVKGILQKADYIFLENPELYLNTLQLKLVVDAIMFQMSANRQSLLLKTTKPGIWYPLITKTVEEIHQERNLKFHFKVEDIVIENLKERLKDSQKEKSPELTDNVLFLKPLRKTHSHFSLVDEVQDKIIPQDSNSTKKSS